jgi:hypothetical protein
LDVQTLGSTVSGQAPNQDPDPEFNFGEIKSLDRSGWTSSLSVEKMEIKKADNYLPANSL